MKEGLKNKIFIVVIILFFGFLILDDITSMPESEMLRQCVKDCTAMSYHPKYTETECIEDCISDYDVYKTYR